MGASQLPGSFLLPAIALVLAGPQPADKPVIQTADVEGQQRQWLVYAPPTAKTTPSPVVFVFHGHGGSMRLVAQSFRVHEHWPEAIVVYPQGLPTATRRDPEGQRSGWSVRDVPLVDEILRRLKAEYQVDNSRLYCTGHSNGGGFTYVLWAQRGDLWAALAPSACNPPPERINAAKPRPLPILHLAGRNDTIVPFAEQEKSMTAVRQVLRCTSEPKPLGKFQVYESSAGTPFVAYLHDGGHRFPSEAVPGIVRFFKEHKRSPTPAKDGP